MGGILRCVVAAVALFVVTPAFAQSADVRQRAREHFDRGLRLFDQSDDKGALAEFLAAYELIPHPSVLYSIGLVYASLGRPVNAVDSLERLLAQNPKLTADQIERAKSTLAAEKAKIGLLSVTTNVPATVEVDGVDAGQTPLAQPLRVPTGIRLVSVLAPGHVPVRREISVASGQAVTLALELQKSEQELAQIDLSVDVIDADVVVDGSRIGRSPLPTALALAPGRRVLEVRRAGYRPFRQTLDLVAGGHGRVSAHLEPDEGEILRSGGSLTFVPSEEQAVAFVDGKPASGLGPIRLAPGRHHVRIERSEFFPVERDVFVQRGRSATMKIALEPTPEKRAAYVDSATSRRTWSWITIGVGAAVTTAGGALFLVNLPKKNDAVDAAEAKKAECQPLEGTATPEADRCRSDLRILLDDRNELVTRQNIFLTGLGVGVATTAVGLTLLLTGDDPHRFDLKPESDVFGKLRLSPVATPRGDMGLFMSGAF